MISAARTRRTRAAIVARASGIEILRFYGLRQRDDPARRGRPAQGEAAAISCSRPALIFDARTARGLHHRAPGAVLDHVLPGGEAHQRRAPLRIRGLRPDRRAPRPASWTAATVPDTRRAAASSARKRVPSPPPGACASTFGEVHGEASTYLTPGGAPRAPTLALRVAGKRVFGDYPFQEAAYIGGHTSVRGLRAERFGGDGSLYGSAELRLPSAASPGSSRASSASSASATSAACSWKGNPPRSGTPPPGAGSGSRSSPAAARSAWPSPRAKSGPGSTSTPASCSDGEVRFDEVTGATIDSLERRTDEELAPLDSLEAAAQRFCDMLYTTFEESTVLVRVFATVPFAALPTRNRTFVEKLVGPRPKRCFIPRRPSSRSSVRAAACPAGTAAISRRGTWASRSRPRTSSRRSR